MPKHSKRHMRPMVPSVINSDRSNSKTNGKRFRIHFGAKPLFALLVIFASTAARIGAESLVRSACYEDGIAVGTYPQRGFILCQHEAEHHLQTD